MKTLFAQQLRFAAAGNRVFAQPRYASPMSMQFIKDFTNTEATRGRRVLTVASLALASLYATPIFASCWVQAVVARKIDGVDAVGVRFWKMPNQTLFLDQGNARYWVSSGLVTKEGKREKQFEPGETIEIGEELPVRDGDVFRVRGGYHDSCTIRGIVNSEKRGIQVEALSNSPGLTPMSSKEFLDAQ